MLMTALQSDGFFQVNLIRQEQARANELAAYRQMFGDGDVEREGAELDQEVATRQAAMQDVMRLYSGGFASLETPMNRFLAVSPANDTHPWLAKTFMEDTGIEPGSLEDMDVRRIASEMVDLDRSRPSGLSEREGSPRPSSDTLSVRGMLAIRERERRRDGTRRDGTRVHRRILMRKQKHKERVKRCRSSSLTLTNDDGGHHVTNVE
jgi:hypothetical protein